MHAGPKAVGQGVADDHRAGDARCGREVDRAVRVERDTALERVDRRGAHRELRWRVVHVGVVARHVDVQQGHVQGRRGHVGHGHRGVVGAGDADAQAGVAEQAARVHHAVGDDFGGDLALRQGLRCRQAVVQGVGVGAVGGDVDRAVGGVDRRSNVGQCAVDLGNCLGVQRVHIGVVGQHVAAGTWRARKRGVARVDPGFADAGAVGHAQRRIISPIDRHNQRRYGNIPVLVGDLISESVGQRLPRQKAVNGWVEIVQGITVATVGSNNNAAKTAHDS